MNIDRIADAVSRNVLYGLRTFGRNRVFALFSILVLGLGIGASTACFSVIRAVLLKPLEYPRPDRLVIVSGGATPTHFEEIRKFARSFGGLGAYTGQENLTLTGGREPEILKAARVSAGFTEILGTVPLLGRGFVPDEDTAGGNPVVMISAEFWDRHFHNDPHAIGQAIDLAGSPFVIVGILPTRFSFPFSGLDLWLTNPSEWPAVSVKSRPLSPFLTVFGRLTADVSIEQATAEAEVLQRQYVKNHPAMLDAKPRFRATLTPLKEHVVGNVRSELWMLFSSVSFVLLIACANLAGLLLARARARSREFAVRLALGAGRHELIGQLLTEGILLAVGGGLLGTLLAVGGVAAVHRTTAWNLPRVEEIHVDAGVLFFTVLLSGLTGILVALTPALAASRPDLLSSLQTRSGSSEWVSSARLKSAAGLRGILVAGQIALSMVLLLGTALLLETVARLSGENLGFDAVNLLTARVALPPQRYATDSARTAFFGQLLEQLRRQPGVVSASASMTLPMTGFAGTPVQDASKPPLRLNERLIATALIVSSGYFETLKIPLKQGRFFNERDHEATQRVTIVDEGLARRFWPSYPNGESAIGKRILIGGVNLQPAEIVGVVGDVHQTVTNSGWPQSVYVALSQNALPSAMLAIRTKANPGKLAPEVREAVRRLDRTQAVSDFQTMDELVESQLGERKLLMLLLGSFAAVATLLAAMGIYGITFYSANERTREIGIRRALGAPATDILWLIIRQTLGVAVIGTLFGLAGAVGFTRLIASLLFHVDPRDPVVMAAAATLFLLVSLVASSVPAWRATRIDPMTALRYE